MYTYCVKMRYLDSTSPDGLGPFRFHHASASLEDAEAFVAAMTVAWEPECQSCRGTKHLEAIKGFREAQPCGHCVNGPKPGPRLGSIELNYDPARFRIEALDGHIIRRNGVIAGHVVTLGEAEAEVSRLIEEHATSPQTQRQYASLKIRFGLASDEEVVRRVVSVWYSIHSPDGA